MKTYEADDRHSGSGTDGGRGGGDGAGRTRTPSTTRADVAKSLQQKQADDSNAALDAAGVPSCLEQARSRRSGARGKAGGDSRISRDSVAPAPAANLRLG